MDRARRGAGGALPPAAAEHHPLGQVDRDRSTIGRRGGRADARPRGRALQADQQRSIPERLPRVHVPLHAAAARPRSIAWRSACRIRISRTSAAGAPAPTASAAAATRGSFRTRRFSGATAIGRIRRRSRRSCPSSACGCTVCRASRWRWIRFCGLGSTAVACARLGVNFIGADIDETYLDEAIAAESRHRRGARAAGTREGYAQGEPAQRRGV